MTLRDAAGTANDFSHSFNVENELITVANNGSTNYFSYDSAGLRVKSTVGRQVTYFPFPGYEETLLNSSQSWHLNEGSGSTAGDSSSHDFDGTIQGATWTTGIAGQALDFDGVNDRVEFNGSVHNEGAFTISAWLRPEQAPTGLGRLVAGTYAWNSDPARIKGWYFGDTWGDTDHFTFGLYDDEGNQAQAVVNNFFSQYLNQWVHVAGVFKPGQSLTLYINGQPVASDTSAVPDKVSLTNLFKIGARADNTTQGFWDGKMDAVQLFGYDLTTTEIQALANKNFNGVPAESSTVRLTFAIAGQAVALKVMGAGTATYYLYTDHLGSTGAMSTTGGGAVSGSTARYYPFGSWRTEPTAAGPDGIPLTDRGFTGHLHNNLGSGAGDIGLIYMGARWYMPGLGRFISADTIVPDPANPQSYNRYSYVRNSPLNLTDPTGHRDEACENNVCELPPSSPPQPVDPLPPVPTGPMVTFSACETCAWTDEEKATIEESAVLTGTRLAETLNAAHGWNLSASDAFLLVYGGSVNFHKTGQSCLAATGNIGCWGRSTGRNNIDVYSDIVDDHEVNRLVGDVHWAVHELGHSFVNAVGSNLPLTNYEKLQAYGFANRGVVGGCNDPITCGFAGGQWEWQRSGDGSTSEEFGDMYLGWVYGQWETNPGSDKLSINGYQRSSYMNHFMPTYVDMAVGH